MEFAELDEARAEALARAWFATSTARFDWLAEQFPDTALGFSDLSLRALLTQANPRFSLGGCPPGEALPLWYDHTSDPALRALSKDSLWLVDAIALYLGEVIIGHDPIRLRWGIHQARQPCDPWHHHPAVIGYRWPYCPIEDMGHFAVKSAHRTAEDPRHVVAAIHFYLEAFAPRDTPGAPST